MKIVIHLDKGEVATLAGAAVRLVQAKSNCPLGRTPVPVGISLSNIPLPDFLKEAIARAQGQKQEGGQQ